MKKTNVALAICAAAALSVASMASAQGLTRAEVKAQLAQAQAEGTPDALDSPDSGSAYLSRHFHSTEPRTEVKAELAQAQANGTLNVLDGPDSGSAYLSEHFHSTEPRSEVNVELAKARADGTLSALVGQDSGSVYLSEHRAEPASGNNAAATASLKGQ